MCLFFPIRIFARSSNLASTTPSACLATLTKSTSVYVHPDLQEKIVKKVNTISLFVTLVLDRVLEGWFFVPRNGKIYLSTHKHVDHVRSHFILWPQGPMAKITPAWGSGH